MQTNAFILQYIPNRYIELKPLRDKHAKYAIVDEFLAKNPTMFAHLDSQRDLNQAVQELADAQEEHADRLMLAKVVGSSSLRELNPLPAAEPPGGHNQSCMPQESPTGRVSTPTLAPSSGESRWDLWDEPAAVTDPTAGRPCSAGEVQRWLGLGHAAPAIRETSPQPTRAGADHGLQSAQIEAGPGHPVAPRCAPGDRPSHVHTGLSGPWPSSVRAPSPALSASPRVSNSLSSQQQRARPTEAQSTRQSTELKPGPPPTQGAPAYQPHSALSHDAISTIAAITADPAQVCSMQAQELGELWRAARAAGALSPTVDAVIRTHLQFAEAVEGATSTQELTALLPMAMQSFDPSTAVGMVSRKHEVMARAEFAASLTRGNCTQPATIAPGAPTHSTPRNPQTGGAAQIAQHYGPAAPQVSRSPMGVDPESARPFSLCDLCPSAPARGAHAPSAQAKSANPVRPALITERQCALGGSPFALIFAPSDISDIEELVRKADAADYTGELASADRFVEHVWVPMVPTEGVVYETIDEDGLLVPVAAAAKGKRRAEAPIFIAVHLKIDRATGGLAHPRHAHDVAFFQHHVGVKGTSTAKQTTNVALLNGLVTSERIAPSEQAKLKLNVWEQANVRDIAGIRSAVRVGKVPYTLMRVNWPTWRPLSIDLQFDNDSECINARRVKVTGTPFFDAAELSWKEQAAKADTLDARARKPEEFTFPRACAALSHVSCASVVELLVRTPLLAGVLGAVASAVATYHAAGKAPSGIHAKAAKAICAATAPELILADFAAGPSPHRLKLAAGAAQALTSVSIPVVRADALPMVFSSVPGCEPPQDYNSLDSLEFEAHPEARKFFESLRATAEYARNGIEIIPSLTRPTFISTMVSTVQMRDWVDAINTTEWVLGCEFVSPRLDPPLFRHLTQVGHDIPLPARCGVAWSSNEYQHLDLCVRLYVHDAIWPSIASRPGPLHFGGLNKLEAIAALAHPVISNIPPALLTAKTAEAASAGADAGKAQPSAVRVANAPADPTSDPNLVQHATAVPGLAAAQAEPGRPMLACPFSVSEWADIVKAFMMDPSIIHTATPHFTGLMLEALQHRRQTPHEFESAIHAHARLLGVQGFGAGEFGHAPAHTTMHAPSEPARRSISDGMISAILGASSKAELSVLWDAIVRNGLADAAAPHVAVRAAQLNATLAMAMGADPRIPHPSAFFNTHQDLQVQSAAFSAQHHVPGPAGPPMVRNVLSGALTQLHTHPGSYPTPSPLETPWQLPPFGLTAPCIPVQSSAPYHSQTQLAQEHHPFLDELDAAIASLRHATYEQPPQTPAQAFLKRKTHPSPAHNDVQLVQREHPARLDDSARSAPGPRLDSDAGDLGEHARVSLAHVRGHGVLAIPNGQPARPVPPTGAARLELLEMRLEELRRNAVVDAVVTVTLASGVVARVITRQSLHPILAAFGCLDTHPTMHSWVAELGHLRAEHSPQQLRVSLPHNNLDAIRIAAAQIGASVTLSDGSARKLTPQGATRAGAAAYDLDHPEAPLIMRVQGFTQTNTRAEYEAGLLAMIASPFDRHAINFSDSEDFVKLMDREPGEFAARLSKANTKNANPAVLAKLIQHIATGQRVAISIKAHCGCEMQDAVDSLAKFACTLEASPSTEAAVDLRACTEVITQWGISKGRDTKQSTLPDGQSVYGSLHRLDIDVLARAHNASKLREQLIAPSQRALSALLALYDSFATRAAAAGHHVACQAIATSATVVERKWRETLVQATLDITGTIKIGASDKPPRHTPQYSEAQRQASIIATCSHAALAALESHKPSTIQEWAAVETDMIPVLTQAGAPLYPPDTSITPEAVLGWISQYVHEEPLPRERRGYWSLFSLLQTATERIAVDRDRLDELADADIDRARLQSVAGIWRRRGQCKQLRRAMERVTSENQFKCTIDPRLFIQAMADKAIPNLSIKSSIVFDLWRPVVLEVSPDSLRQFGAPWTWTHVFREITAAAPGKAFSRISQISKDMFKAIYRQAPAARVLIEKLDKASSDGADECQLQHMLEAWAACVDAVDYGTADHRVVCRLIAAIFNVVELTGVANPDWCTIVLSPIFKNKVDQSVKLPQQRVDEINASLSHWREVAQADALRTLYGSCVNTLYNAFADANQLHRHFQLAYMPGIDACGVHHLRFDIVQILSVARPVAWLRRPLCLAVLAADFKYFFSTILGQAREEIMAENSFPAARRRGQRAIHTGMQITMIDSNGPIPPVAIDCELMGSAEACMFAVAAGNGYADALHKGGRGFALPRPGDIAAPLASRPPSETIIGGGQCDDITLFAGGFGKSPVQTIADIEWSARLTAQWAASRGFIFSIDPGNPNESKSVIMASLYDEYGFQVPLEPNIWLPTDTGMVRVPRLPEGTSFKMLGVMRAARLDEQIKANADALAIKVATKLRAFMNSGFPAGAQAAYLNNSATGGLRWSAAKTCVPWKVIAAASKLEAAEARTLYGLTRSAPTAYLFARVCDGGCGVVNSEQVVLANALAALMAGLNSHREYVRDLTRYSLEVCRAANDIGQAEGSTFFGWCIEGISPSHVDALHLTPGISAALRFVLTYGGSFDFDNTTGEWVLCRRWDGRLMCSSKSRLVKEIVDVIFVDRWKSALLHAAIDCEAQQAVSDPHRELANRWRADRTIDNAVVRFAVRAAIDQLPSAVNLCRWRLRPTCACVCGNDWASLAHISQSCPLTAALVVKRSQGLVELCRDALSTSGSASWSFVGNVGCHPPDFLLPLDWRSKLRALPEKRGDQHVWVQHRLPDLLLVSAAAGGRLNVIIADPTVCWHGIREAEERKRRNYAPLRELIESHTQRDLESCEVIPIAFTARATPPPEWSSICSKMKFRTGSAALLKKIQKHLLQSLRDIFRAWQAHHDSQESADTLRA